MLPQLPFRALEQSRVAGKSHYWRSVVCEGCERRCRYRDFRVFDRNGFADTKASLWKDDPDPSTWRYKRRGTVLGIMHEEKRQMWESMIASCPHRKRDE